MKVDLNLKEAFLVMEKHPLEAAKTYLMVISGLSAPVSVLGNFKMHSSTACDQ